MANVKYCPLCQRDVGVAKKFNWRTFLLLNLTLVGGGFYLIWYVITPGSNCSICGAKGLENARGSPQTNP